MRKEYPTQEYLLERLIYDEYTGILYWNEKKVIKPQDKTWNALYAFNPAGENISSTGYKRLTLDGKQYKTHIIIFLMLYGYRPEVVEHEDRVRSNNLRSNLRDATQSQNLANSSSRRTIPKGCYYLKDKDKWMVSVQKNYKQHYGGLFNSLDEAKVVADNLRLKLHKEFSN